VRKRLVRGILAGMEIPLDRDEIRILRTVIENELSALRMERADTHRKEFRDLLARRKAVLQKVVEAPGSAATD
jgi:hypothetical protein